MILEGSDIMRITTTTAATLTVFAAFTDIGPTRTARGRQTTAISSAELAIAKGAVNVGGGPTLTVVGYADVSGTVTGTGQFTTAVNVSSGQSINEGDDLWALYGNNASTVTVLRAQSIADDLQSGVFAYLSTRPSSNVGNAQAYTIDGATALAPWIVGVV